MSDKKSPPQLIVIGSSAGGIEALSTLVSTLPTPFPAPIIIAQHLDPSRPSHLGEILARHSPIPVITVHEHERLQEGTIYVVPSNHHIEVTDHDITLQSHKDSRPKPSIDLLLSSAAEVYGEQLIALILTGTGSDGALGARAVKQAGGTVVIQNPSTAAYPGMPEAVEPKTVDIVADLARIGPILFDLLTGVASLAPGPTQTEAESELEAFLDRVREQTGIDFRSYKTPTILRRLQRRIIAAGASNLAGYAIYLENHPDEYQQLVSSLLIKVTGFMRDKELFDVLRETVIPDLIQASRDRLDPSPRNSQAHLRIWSAGCATGEEAYSLAILVLEALGEELPNFTVKIFATDLDSEAIAFARRGLYPAATLAHMPDDLLAHYFTRSKKGYEVKKQVRNLVVFGEHDLAERAPFPRIDMVLCRNVLIYFNRELQQRALQLFAFALREGGYLVLGKTETVSPISAFFAPELPQYKVFRRHGKERPMPLFRIQGHTLHGSAIRSHNTPHSISPVPQPTERRQRSPLPELFLAQQESLQSRLSKENLLFNLPLGVVVVDRRYDIQEINSAARRLLGVHTVAVGEDLLHLAQNVPNKAFRAAIDTVFRENTMTKLTEVHVPQMTTGEPTYLQIECYPQPGEEQHGPCVENGEDEAIRMRIKDESGNPQLDGVMVLVTDITEMVLSRRELERANASLSAQAAELQTANAALAARNEESSQLNTVLSEVHREAEEVAARHARQIEVLAEANGDLLAANHELAKANSDLRSTADEFLVANEEAQAAVEEVETLNEEMQATNEELETLNEELQAAVEELNTSNSDLAVRGDELQSLAVSLETQQRDAEREKAQLEAILAGLADAVLVVTEKGKPVLSNEAYRRLFGTDEAGEHGDVGLFKDGAGLAERMADERSRPLLPDETPQARAARGETFIMDLTLASTSGKEKHWLEAIGQPVRGANEEKWGVVVVRDITERSLRIMQEEFTSLAGYELRTPLTTVKGYLHMLEKSLKDQGSERQLNYVQIALGQVDRQMRLIEDLLDVARLQSGKFSLRRKPVRLDTLLEQVVETAQILAKGQKIELTIGPELSKDAVASASDEYQVPSTKYQVPEHNPHLVLGTGHLVLGSGVGPLLVNGDAARLEQAVLNLLTNAITYAPGSARIDVRLFRVDGTSVDGAATSMVEICVQDYGKGIAAKDLPEVFTRFYQVTLGNPLPAQGLGLGLYITRQIVEAHGGTISVESTEGNGATFIIKLPLLEQELEQRA
jgi:two-component system CheB/CheR fusion protein